MMMLVMSQSFISLPSSLFVCAVISEINDLNQNERKNNNFETVIFNLPSFPGIDITDPLFCESYCLTISAH